MHEFGDGESDDVHLGGAQGIIERPHYDDNQRPDLDEYEDPSAWHGTSGFQTAREEAAAGRRRDAAAEGSKKKRKAKFKPWLWAKGKGKP